MDYIQNNKISWNNISKRYQNNTNLNFDTIDFGDNNFPNNDDLKLISINDYSGKNVLELGCGGGNISIILAKHAAYVKGIDISQEQIKAAENNAKAKSVNVEFQVSSLEEYVPSKKFDFVISICAFQYIKI